MIAAYPAPNEKLIDSEIEQLMKLPMDAILAIRNIRGEMNISPKERVRAGVRPENDAMLRSFEQTAGYVTALAGLSEISISLTEKKPEGASTSAIAGAEIFVVRPEQAIDKDAERDRIRKEIAKISKDIEVFSKKLSNKSFVEKAPKEVVEKDTAKLEEFRAKRDKLEQSLKALG